MQSKTIPTSMSLLMLVLLMGMGPCGPDHDDMGHPADMAVVRHDLGGDMGGGSAVSSTCTAPQASTPHAAPASSAWPGTSSAPHSPAVTNNTSDSTWAPPRATGEVRPALTLFLIVERKRNSLPFTVVECRKESIGRAHDSRSCCLRVDARQRNQSQRRCRQKTSSIS